MEEHGFFDLDARLSSLSQRCLLEDPRASLALRETLLLGWIHHDNALEGIIVSHQDILSALRETAQADSAQEALYRSIRDYKSAIDFVEQQVQARKPHQRGLVSVSLLHQLHDLLTPLQKSKGSPFRTGIPTHRAYHHRIAAAGEIPHRLRKLCESIDAESEHSHPLSRAAAAHFELLAIYPWSEHSGRVARLLMNLLLRCDGYPPALIVGSDRQRYYQCLCLGSGSLAELIADSLDSYCVSANQFFESFASLRSPRIK